MVTDCGKRAQPMACAMANMWVFVKQWTFARGQQDPSRSSGLLIEGMKPVVGLLIAWLLLWLTVAIIGFTVSGLFWLAIIALVMFVGMAVFAATSIDTKS